MSAPDLLPRPEVAANFAQSWDARISTRSGSPATFGSARDQRRLLEIRASGDAILVGRKTLETDRMQMGLSDEGLRRERLARGQAEYPLRVVVSGSGQFSPAHPVFHHPVSPLLLFSTGAMPVALREGLPATVHLCEGAEVDLRAMLAVLALQYGVRRLICEGGAGLFRSLLALDLVDELNLTLSPRLFGGEAAPTLTGVAGAFLPERLRFKLEAWELIEGECFTRYRRTRKRGGR